MLSAKDILEELNQTDERRTLEAKRCASGQIGKSVYETVCAFANEPNMGGGYIILGVINDDGDLYENYSVCGVDDPDKIQQDFVNGCANQFNHRIRPGIEVEEIDGKNVVVVFVPESDKSDKPIYFNNQSLPQAARRRIGSGDVKCTEDDLKLFYGERSGESFDCRVIDDATMEDLDPEEIEYYRTLRRKINPTAEELTWSDEELLESLSAIRTVDGHTRPTLTGVLLFGTRMAHRRLLPAVRVDYVRVAGSDWVEDADQRFEKTIDMRGPLLRLVDRALAAVVDDLPKGFRLEPGEIQADTPMLPSEALREAIVNAVMHRSYQEHTPIQVIRYHNRVEILNAGFSLKPEEELGQPRSELRNPHLAAVFHETNTAETKGSGIRVMRRLMREAGFSAPTFQSDRENNSFTSRFLLAHFLNERDLRWLETMGNDFTNHQKVALVFLREQGAIDNLSLRQLVDCDTLAASSELRKLRDRDLLVKHGEGSKTYYRPGSEFVEFEEDDELVPLEEELTPLEGELTPLEGELTPLEGELTPLEDKLDHLDGKLDHLGGELDHLDGKLDHLEAKNLSKDDILNIFSADSLSKIQNLGSRPGEKIRPVILELCAQRALNTEMLSRLLERNYKRLFRGHIRPLIEDGLLALTYPDMPKHPDQAYRTSEKGLKALKDTET